LGERGRVREDAVYIANVVPKKKVFEVFLIY